jgi:3-methylcrotonyl-CoA carboxylase alpha subunit
MPSTVSKVFVKVGQHVKKGENLVSLEAMKMEHLIKAAKDGVIKSVYAQEGKFMEANSTIIEFEEEKTN